MLISQTSKFARLFSCRSFPWLLVGVFLLSVFLPIVGRAVLSLTYCSPQFFATNNDFSGATSPEREWICRVLEWDLLSQYPQGISLIGRILNSLEEELQTSFVVSRGSLFWLATVAEIAVMVLLFGFLLVRRPWFSRHYVLAAILLGYVLCGPGLPWLAQRPETHAAFFRIGGEMDRSILAYAVWNRRILREPMLAFALEKGTDHDLVDGGWLDLMIEHGELKDLANYFLTAAGKRRSLEFWWAALCRSYRVGTKVTSPAEAEMFNELMADLGVMRSSIEFARVYTDLDFEESFFRRIRMLMKAADMPTFLAKLTEHPELMSRETVSILKVMVSDRNTVHRFASELGRFLLRSEAAPKFLERALLEETRARDQESALALNLLKHRQLKPLLEEWGRQSELAGAPNRYRIVWAPADCR